MTSSLVFIISSTINHPSTLSLFFHYIFLSYKTKYFGRFFITILKFLFHLHIRKHQKSEKKGYFLFFFIRAPLFYASYLYFSLHFLVVKKDVLKCLQGLQLCLEPKVESHFLRLKLAPPIINLPGTIETPTELNIIKNNNNNNNNINDCKWIGVQNTDMGGWSFLQSLGSPIDSTEHNEIFVHPLVKSTPFTLSEKSLELCTESLGSETGSYDIPLPEAVDCNTSKPRENSMTRRMSLSSSFPPSLTSISGSISGCNNPSSKGKENLVIRRMSPSSSFPPPLTSISGSNSVQVMSHREGGRLVVQAVNVPSCIVYFHAERSGGRLRLCLLKDTTPILDDEGREDEEEQEEIVEEDDVVEDVEVNEEKGVIEDDIVYEENVVGYEENGVVEDEVVYEKNGVVKGEVEEEKCQYWGDEDVIGKNENVGGEIGKGKFPSPSSCKERGCGRKGLLHWKPYLVAT